MTDAVHGLRRPPRSFGRAGWAIEDAYLYLLFFLLAGYACTGRSFASLGLGPLYIGDAILAVGLLVAVRTGCLFATFNALPHLLLTVMMVWVVLRTLPYIGSFGLDALRDSVIIMYGLFAFVVMALLLESPRCLVLIIKAYSRFIGFFVPVSVIIGAASMLQARGSDIPFASVRPGELASHLGGAAVFALLGMRRVNLWWILGLLAGMATLIPSRGGTIACVLAIAMAAVLSGRVFRLMPAILLGGVLFFAAYASGVHIRTVSGRDLGPEQLVEGIDSILGGSNTGNFDGTRAWRLRWWATIEDYTFHGDYFWTGKGFGTNIAEADGFMVGQELGGPPLRSPHSAHLTILARTGVPGLTLWLLVLGSWFVAMAANMFRARRRGDAQFANLFLWVACYVAAMLIDASFDVALEGPMLGIWFWCLFGLGGGMALIYRAALSTLPPASTAPVTLWTDTVTAPRPQRAKA